MTRKSAHRSKGAASLAYCCTVLVFIVVGLIYWRGEPDLPRSSSAEATVTEEAAGDGTGSRTYAFAITVVDPADPSSRSIAKEWSGQLRCVGTEGDVERITSLAPQLQGAPGERFEWIELEVGGQIAKVHHPGLALGDEAVVTVEAELLVDGAVRAVDAGTGHDLPRVDVVLARGAEGQFLLPPSRTPPATSSRSEGSPVAMPAARGRATYWLGAPGHAWRRITYSGADGGTPVHALDKGGALTLRRVGSAGPEVSVFVSLIQPARDGAAEEQFGRTGLVEGADVTFEGLPPGDVLARFSMIAGDTPEFVVHEETVRVEAGAHPTLELDLARHWTPEGFASLDLLLDVRAETDLSAYELALVRSGPEGSAAKRKPVSLLHKGDGSLRLWSQDALLPGRYEVSVKPSGCSAEFDLVAGEAKTLELALAAAPIVRLWCLDASNGLPVKPSLIVWRAAPAESSAAWSSTQFRWAEDASVLRMDPGAFEIGVRAQGFITELSQIEVQPGVNEAVVELTPTQSIELQVTLWCDGAEMPISADEWSRARLRDQAGRDAVASVSVGTGSGNGECCRETATARLVVGAPGQYDLQLALPPQFRGPVTKRVTVDAAGSSLSIELERISSTALR
jgi:hypothetical protein